MRRILVENARRRRSLKRGGAYDRRLLDERQIVLPEPGAGVLALDEALTKLAQRHPKIADLVQLRFFCGVSIREAAKLIGVSSRTADDYWAYAKAWLLREIERDAG